MMSSGSGRAGKKGKGFSVLIMYYRRVLVVVSTGQKTLSLSSPATHHQLKINGTGVYLGTMTP
eukprot:scaffold111135_cov58-Attheya_sp.AAC.4